MNVLTYVFVSLLLPVLLSAPAVAQGRSGDGIEPLWIQDSHVLIVVPQNRKLLAAYSISRNHWSRIEVASPLGPDTRPLVSDGMVAVKAGRIVYAYSAKTAAWDHVMLTSAGDPAVHGNAITVKDKDALYIFAANAEAWTGIDLRSGDPLTIKRVSGGQGDGAEQR